MRARGSRAFRGLAGGVGPSGRGAKVLAPKVLALALGQLREGSVASSCARDPSLGLGARWRESKAAGAEVPPPFSVGPNWEGPRSQQLPRGWRPLGQCWGRRTDPRRAGPEPLAWCSSPSGTFSAAAKNCPLGSELWGRRAALRERQHSLCSVPQLGRDPGPGGAHSCRFTGITERPSMPHRCLGSSRAGHVLLPHCPCRGPC